MVKKLSFVALAVGLFSVAILVMPNLGHAQTVPPRCGDLDNNGSLTSTDVVLEQNYVFLGQTPSSTPNAFWRADVNGDGILTSADAVRLLNAVYLGQPLSCAVQNQPPVINYFTRGSTSTLPAGSLGTWYARATDPEGQMLSYTVAWGDFTSSTPTYVSSGLAVTFNHTYNTPGTYYPRLVVSDLYGGVASTTTSVSVTSSSPSPAIPVQRLRDIESGQGGDNHLCPLVSMMGTLLTNISAMDFGSAAQIAILDQALQLAVQIDSLSGDHNLPNLVAQLKSLAIQRDSTLFPLVMQQTQLIVILLKGNCNIPPYTSISIAPQNGHIGTVITISGSGFTAMNNSVAFETIGNINYANRVVQLPSADGKTIIFTVPAVMTRFSEGGNSEVAVTPGTYQISVSTQNAKSNSVNFAVLANASISNDATVKSLQDTIAALTKQLTSLVAQVNALNAGQVQPESTVIDTPFTAEGGKPQPTSGMRTPLSQDIESGGGGLSNQPPTATVNGTSTVVASTTAYWSFKGTDPEGSFLSYSINWGDGSIETGSSPSGATFTRPHAYYNFSTSSIMQTIQFRVTDGQGLSGTASFLVTVLPNFQPPSAPTVTWFSPTGGESWQQGSSHYVSFQWNKPSGFTFQPGASFRLYRVQNGAFSVIATFPLASSSQNVAYGNYFWTIPAFTPTGSYQLHVELLEGLFSMGGTPQSNSFSVVGSPIEPPLCVGCVPVPPPPPALNQSPTLIQPFSGLSSFTSGQSGTWTARATDPEGGSLSYTIYWGDGQTSQGTVVSGGTISVAHIYVTTANVTRYPYIVVTDLAGATVQGTPLSVNVYPATPPPPPKNLYLDTEVGASTLFTVQEQVMSIADQLQAIMQFLRTR